VFYAFDLLHLDGKARSHGYLLTGTSEEATGLLVRRS
jgi:hypothetical protein